jgi:nitric oxide reductase NorQ protein
MLKDLKPSTRQRFVALDFDFPAAEREAGIVVAETGATPALARTLVDLARRLRGLQDRGLAELPSTRLLVHAARLALRGTPLRQACHAAIVAPLSDEPTLLAAMGDLVEASIV